MKQFLLLVAVIAVVFGALLVSLWVLDLIKMAELQNDLRKIFGVLGVAAVAGVLILSLVKIAQKGSLGRLPELGQSKWTGNQEALTFLGYRPIPSLNCIVSA